MKSFDYCVFIGRFQPFHHAHYEMLREALSLAKDVVVVIGSANKAPSIQNPWTAEQREKIITECLSEEERAHVKFVYVRDYFYLNNRWLTEVQQLVYNATDGIDDSKICNLGEENEFPQWKFFKIRNLDRMPHATVIRGLYFTHDSAYKNHLLPCVAATLEDFKNTDTFKKLKDEYDYVRSYRASWDGAPFPPIFVTCDSLVVKSGHILVVRRKGNPGKGLIALPGGFVNQNEYIKTAAIRELKEETGIKLSKEELEKAIVEQKVFDYPTRSLRGRTITNVFLIDLGSGLLPLVKGGDDADKAFWMPLSEFANSEASFFEDHWQIASHFINKF